MFRYGFVERVNVLLEELPPMRMAPQETLIDHAVLDGFKLVDHRSLSDTHLI